MAFGYFACEPPRGLHPPPSGCAFENEDAARRICSGDAIEVVIYLDARGRLIDAYMKDYRSPDLDACMFKEAQQWSLEPALTCTGETIPQCSACISQPCALASSHRCRQNDISEALVRPVGAGDDVDVGRPEHLRPCHVLRVDSTG